MGASKHHSWIRTRRKKGVGLGGIYFLLFFNIILIILYNFGGRIMGLLLFPFFQEALCTE
jgi:hypothetical protein